MSTIATDVRDVRKAHPYRFTNLGVAIQRISIATQPFCVEARIGSITYNGGYLRGRYDLEAFLKKSGFDPTQGHEFTIWLPE